MYLKDYGCTRDGLIRVVHHMHFDGTRRDYRGLAQRAQRRLLRRTGTWPSRFALLIHGWMSRGQLLGLVFIFVVICQISLAQR
jgi:hypothetical protein